MDLTDIVTLITEIGILLGVIIPVINNMQKIADGTRCQLRSEMLRIYYHNKDAGQIHQYEFENFIMLYEAYKALHGNSFIDKIFKEVQSWDIIA
jgi:hypothetical protein